MMIAPDTTIVDAICRWAEQLVVPGGPPRVNVRLVFGNAALAGRVGEELSRRSGERAWYIVRTSANPDAVRLRHGRPTDLPLPRGVTSKTPLVYVLFWLPGERGHEHHAQSLADLRAVDVPEVMSHSAERVLPAEAVIDSLCKEAAQSWDAEKDRALAVQLLGAAWRAVRTCLRERHGGRQRSIPFVSNVEHYARYLQAATIPEAEWKLITRAERPRALVRRWGEALPELSMFRFPALTTALDLQLDTAKPLQGVKKDPFPAWVDILEGYLAENIEVAMDFASLHDTIAGKSTIESRISQLAQQIPLSETDQEAAKKALVKFCHDGDPETLKSVDWLFWSESANRRSASLGLKGLLISRGRRKPTVNPIDKAASDTVASLKALTPGNEDAIERFHQTVEGWKQSVTRDGRAGLEVANVLRAIAAGSVPSQMAEPGVKTAFTLAVSSADRKPEIFDSLAASWSRFADKKDAAAIYAPSLLLGLARLFAERLREGRTEGKLVHLRKDGAEETLTLTIVNKKDNDAPSLELSVNSFQTVALDQIQGWLNDPAVLRALHGGEEVDDEDDEVFSEARSIQVQVARRSGKGPAETMGTLELVWSPRDRRLVAETRPDTLTSWRRTFAERPPTGARLLNEILDKTNSQASGEAQRYAPASQAWSAYVKALGRDDGWDAVFLVAPVSPAARAWVDAWGAAIKSSQSSAKAADVERRKGELMAQMQKASVEQRFDVMTSLLAELTALQSTSAPSTPVPDVDDIRSLLRACTAAAFEGDACRHLALTPHHPLVLRLRGVADTVLAEVIHTIWTQGFPKEALDSLDEVLERWGLPEPVHCYGFWSGEPLVFESWLSGSRFGLFSRLGSGRENDAAQIGVRDVIRTVERYAELFPEASHRLRLRIQADRDGGWAWQIMSRLLESNSNLRADLDLVTDLPERDNSAIERGVQEKYEYRRAFELGLEGAAPQVRVRRTKSPGATAHLSLVVGDEIEAFRSTLKAVPAESKLGAKTWDSSVLFAEAQPDLHQYEFSVGDPVDELSQGVAAAVGFASHQAPVVFQERYAFDKTKCEEPLKRLQDGAHWLVLASRQPLYRAVQQAGRQVTSLLDFYTSSERGRPVHVCASLPAQQAGSDLIRLDAVLRNLLRDEAPAEGAKAVVRAALEFAPGLAMRCAGAVTLIEIEGLLGLLLTGQELRRQNPKALVLSLDQHRGLLAHSGKLGDVISVALENGAITITVGESKFTTSPVDTNHSLGAAARGQIEDTVRRLHHLSLSHPLCLSVRAKLARAIVHQIHLAGVDKQRAKELSPLVEAATSRDVPIIISPASSGNVHIWSLSAQTKDDRATSDHDAELFVHGHTTTVARFKELVNAAVL